MSSYHDSLVKHYEEEEEEGFASEEEEITQSFADLEVSQSRSSANTPPRPTRSASSRSMTSPYGTPKRDSPYGTPKRVKSKSSNYFMHKKIDLKTPFEILPEWCISSYDGIRKDNKRCKVLSLLKDVGHDVSAFKIQAVDPEHITIECPMILQTLKKRLEDGPPDKVFGFEKNQEVMKDAGDTIVAKFKKTTIKYLLEAPDGYTLDIEMDIKFTVYNGVENGALRNVFAEWLIVLCPRGAPSGTKVNEAEIIPDVNSLFSKKK